MTNHLALATQKLENKGFLDIEVDPTLDLIAEIEKLKKEKKCCLVSPLLSR